MNKIKRSKKLLKAAFAVLFREKKLLLFPLIATGLALVVALFYCAPIAFSPTGHAYSSTAHWRAIGERISQSFSSPPQHSANHPVLTGFANGLTGGSHVIFQHWWITLLFAVSYFTSMFLGTFGNVAFYHEIMQALNGNAVSIRRGFQFAAMRWRAVLLWSLFAGLIGYIIRAIEQRVGIFGKLIAGLIGFTWSLASIFIIPTLVRDMETTNPLQLLRHSAGTLNRTWGELVVGFVGMEAIFIFYTMPIVLAIVFISGFTHHAMSPLLILCVTFLMFFPLSWICQVVNSVYRCALYVYATEGVVPDSFDKELLDSAWQVK
jgi:ABC-type multidrug transport system fused ATPase/permease subunit